MAGQQGIIRLAKKEDGLNIFSPFEYVMQDLENRDNKFSMSSTAIQIFGVREGDIVEYFGAVSGGSHHVTITKVLRRFELN